MRDGISNIHPTGAAVVTVSDNTAVVSPIVDVRGHDSAIFLIGAGTLVDADATFVVLVEHSDASDMTGAAAVIDDELSGTELLAAFTFANDGEARKIGYIGSKRYCRCTVTPAANTGSAPIAIIPVLGLPHNSPTPNPPS